MKRFLLICAVVLFICACDKETNDPVYDTHLFAQLRAHSWIFDSARTIGSVMHDTVIYALDTVRQVTFFSPQYYIVNNEKDTMILDSATNAIRDTVAVLDTAAYQVTYDNPNKIYYYYVGGLVVPGQYLAIDTVNDQKLVLNKVDTLQNVSVIYYHAK